MNEGERGEKEEEEKQENIDRGMSRFDSFFFTSIFLVDEQIKLYRFPIRILLGEKDGKIQFEFHYLPFSMNRLSLDGKIGMFFFSNDNEL